MENDKRARERDPPITLGQKRKKLVSITIRDSLSSLRNYLQVVESTRHATLLHHHVLSFVHDFLMPTSFFFLLILPFSLGIVIITRLDVELFLFYIPPPSWSSPLLLCVHTSMALAKYMRRRLSILVSQAKTPKKAESSWHSKSIIESSSSSSFENYKNLTCNIWGSAKKKPIKTKRETAVKCPTLSARVPPVRICLFLGLIFTYLQMTIVSLAKHKKCCAWRRCWIF